MRPIRLNVLIVFVVLAGAILIKVRSAGSPAKDRVPATAVVNEEDEFDSDLAALSKVPAPLVAKPEVNPPSPLQVKPVVRVPVTAYEKELQTYAAIQRKVFLNASEQQQKSQLLHDRQVLRGMGARLTQAPADLKASIEQNAAIDLLLEALRSGDAGTASEVLKDVVTDKQVEDPSLDSETRHSLAGVKAEVLFQWSALKPTEAAEIATWLPGPVSQNIWQNVLNAQASNQAESADLGQ